MPVKALIGLIAAAAGTTFAQNGYSGSESCAPCHAAIHASQSASRMARTWQGPAPALLGPGYSRSLEEKPEPAVRYLVSSHEGRLRYRVQLPGQDPVELEVAATLGGDRHGSAFLARLREINGVAPGRDVMIATRHFHSVRSNGLELNPSFPARQPIAYDAALGRVLSPDFETRCLNCHGDPQFKPSSEPGVRCESCHGPGQAHLEAVRNRSADQSIFNPGRLAPPQLNQFCSQCHSGFERVVDPMPRDLLISNQVTALELSECFIQSGGQLGCLSCHDPHSDASHRDEQYAAACRSCHAPDRTKAGLCPVDTQQGCVGCHMPAAREFASLPLVDHWIRVFPGSAPGPSETGRESASQIRPRRLFLRLLVVRRRSEAESVLERLSQGESFFDLARELSIDPSRPLGGFLGAMWLDRMDSRLAEPASRLKAGEVSPVVALGDEYALLQRLPRDFRWQAEGLADDAQRLADLGQWDDSISRFQESLRLNPHFLKALVALGVTYAQKGEAGQAIALLEQAARVHPQSALTQFNLGISYALVGASEKELQAYQQAVRLDPEFVPAHVNLGLTLLSQERGEEAERQFREAIRINPLAVQAHLGLARALQTRGQGEAAARHLIIARAIDPRLNQ